MAGNTAAAALSPDRAWALVGTHLVSAEGRNTGETDNFLVDGTGRGCSGGDAPRAGAIAWAAGSDTLGCGRNP